MQLRTHPKMKWEGFSNWPPVWATSPMGEEGVLTSVEMNEAGNTLPRHLVLTMMHLGRGSSAMLCPRLFEILKGCVGWEIGRIGDLDVEL